MTVATGIYGYTFTKPFDIAGMRCEPLYRVHRLASERGRDTKAFHLTGILSVLVPSFAAFRTCTERFYDLEVALTFCEQQRVVLCHAVEVRPGEDVCAMVLADEVNEIQSALPLELLVSDSLTRSKPRPTSGQCLQFDAFAPDTRRRFLDLVMGKLQDQSFQQASGFRSAFFRNTEMVKMGEVPIDVTYSLLFTGLELPARKFLKPQCRVSLSDLLKSFLRPHGFDITDDEAQQVAQCRNALFHQGELTATYHPAVGGAPRSIRLTLPNVEALFSDVLLKVLGFDDPQINWNRWRDRMPFQ